MVRFLWHSKLKLFNLHERTFWRDMTARVIQTSWMCNNYKLFYHQLTEKSIYLLLISPRIVWLFILVFIQVQFNHVRISQLSILNYFKWICLWKASWLKWLTISLLYWIVFLKFLKFHTYSLMLSWKIQILPNSFKFHNYHVKGQLPFTTLTVSKYSVITQ